MESILLDRLATLSHPARMNIFRLLVRRYPDALAAGEILRLMDLKPSTASVYLSALKSAGLLNQQRVGTSLLYSANIAATQEIADDLLQDCCRGRTDLSRALPRNSKTKHVLFLCTGNSARSIMAEALLNAHNNAGLVAASAGTKPRGEVHNIALDVLRGHGHATDGLRSKSFTTICAQTAPDWDFVFTVCDSAANQDSPPVGGAPITSHWSTIDPVPAATSAHEAPQTPELIRAGFEQCYSLLKSRIARFSALPFDTASRSELQSLVDGIALEP